MIAPACATLTDALTCAATTSEGLAFYSATGALTDSLSYQTLAEEAKDLARRMPGAGIRPGDRIGLIAETSPDFLRWFYACQFAGVVPCPLPYSVFPGGRAAYAARIAALAATAGAAAVVMSPGLKQLGIAGDAVRTLAWDDLATTPATGALTPLGPDDIAYVQFSSGSTADPKGILNTQRAVCANASAIVRHGLGLGPGDRACSWLPLYHDMGMVGFSIAPLFVPCSVDYLAPASFARRPELWLALMSRNAATVTYAPPFAWRLAADRARDRASELDLSHLRIAGVGGDTVRADILDAFAAATMAACFDRKAFLPSYGLAESVLAVSFADRRLGPVTSDSGHVSCGAPLLGHTLRIVDAEGGDVAPGVTGRILVKGPSVAQAAVTAGGGETALQDSEGFLDTGDMGAMTPMGLIITGRARELIIQRGRNLWPRDIELLAEQAAGARPGDVAAFGVSNGEDEDVIVLIETRLQGDAREQLAETVRAAVFSGLGVSPLVTLTPPRTLPVTSSGKIARALARTNYLNGAYGPCAM